MQDLTAADLEILRTARAKCTTMEMFSVLEVVDKLLHDTPLRRCMRCGERVRIEGETVLCDGVVSKLAPLSVHVPITPTILGYPVRFVDPPSPSISESTSKRAYDAHGPWLPISPEEKD